MTKNVTSFKAGPEHWNWNGGFQKKQGYIHILIDAGKYMPLHVLLMEWKIGRRLKKGEVVHHINHDRADNRLSNLQLMTASEHGRLHATGFKRSEKTKAFLREQRKDWFQKEKHPQWKSNVTREEIVELLNTFKIKANIAFTLGICPDTLRARIKYYGIKFNQENENVGKFE